MASTAVYSATKAAMHSYSLSQRYLLRQHGVKVIEIAPPWVRTELLNSSEEERAMPLDAFIAGAMEQLATDADEILVGQAPQMRANPGPGEHALVDAVQRHGRGRPGLRLKAGRVVQMPPGSDGRKARNAEARIRPGRT